MNLTRFTRRDGILFGVCAVIFALSILIGINWFDAAFPEASIDFKTTRSSSEPLALEALELLDLSPPDGYRHASRFSYDGNAKTYLEKELGLDSAMHLLSNPVRLWSWSHRWFKPSTKEEYRASISPEGEIVAITHLIEEDDAGAFLERDSARHLAETFIREKLGLNLDTFLFLEGQQTGRPHRRDWSFTWRLKDFEPLPGSSYRYSVSLNGDQIGGYREYLHVPEAWNADFKRLRSLNELAGNVDSVFMLLTLIAIVAVFLARIRKQDIHWKTAIWFGVVAAILTYLTNLNQLPVTLYHYNTTSSWSGFLLRELVISLLVAIGVGVLIALLTATAEAIFRNRYPQLHALPRIFTLRGLRTKGAFVNIVVGLTMTAFFFAYQVVFYLLTHRFGGWSPADVPYTNLLNTAFPWIAVLFVGFMPAVSEEFMSRMFSIPFLQNLFRNRYTWLAVLIPAFIWGFGHATYPNEPFWIRGVEVGVAGVIIGVVMLRFGILAPLVWHYTVDALYTAFLLFRSDNPYFIVTAAVASGLMVIPLVAALIAYWRKGGFLPEEGVRNADVVLAKSDALSSVEEATHLPGSEVPEAARKPVTASLGARSRLLALLLLVCGLLVARPERPDDTITSTVPPADAIPIMADGLRSSGLADPDTLFLRTFSRQGTPSRTSQQAYLLKELGSVSTYNALVRDLHSEGIAVYAYSRGNRLRFYGFIDAADRQLTNLVVMMPEEMAGDTLSIDSARTLVRDRLTRAGVDLNSLVEISVRENARPNRRDYTFTFEAPEGDARHVGEAKFRYLGSVTGSHVSASGRPFFHLPESWTRDRNASTASRTIRIILIIIAYSLFIGYALMRLVIETRRGHVPWKRAFLLAIVPGLLSLAGVPEKISAMELQYFLNAEIAWNVFLTSGVIGIVIGFSMNYLLFAIVFALLGTIYADRLPLLSAGSRKQSMLDSLVALGGSIGALYLFTRLVGWLGILMPTAIPVSEPTTPAWFNAPFMWGAILDSSLTQTAVVAGLLGFAAYLFQGPLRSLLGRMMVLIGALLLMQGFTAVDLNEWLFQLITGAVTLAAVILVLKQLVRGHPVRFFVVVWGVVALNAAAPGLRDGVHAGIALHGWLFVAFAAVVLLLWLLGLPARTSR